MENDIQADDGNDENIVIKLLKEITLGSNDDYRKADDTASNRSSGNWSMDSTHGSSRSNDRHNLRDSSSTTGSNTGDDNEDDSSLFGDGTETGKVTTPDKKIRPCSTCETKQISTEVPLTGHCLYRRRGWRTNTSDIENSTMVAVQNPSGYNCEPAAIINPVSAYVVKSGTLDDEAYCETPLKFNKTIDECDLTEQRETDTSKLVEELKKECDIVGASHLQPKGKYGKSKNVSRDPPYSNMHQFINRTRRDNAPSEQFEFPAVGAVDDFCKKYSPERDEVSPQRSTIDVSDVLPSIEIFRNEQSLNYQQLHTSWSNTVKSDQSFKNLGLMNTNYYLYAPVQSPEHVFNNVMPSKEDTVSSSGTGFVQPIIPMQGGPPVMGPPSSSVHSGGSTVINYPSVSSSPSSVESASVVKGPPIIPHNAPYKECLGPPSNSSYNYLVHYQPSGFASGITDPQYTHGSLNNESTPVCPRPTSIESTEQENIPYIINNSLPDQSDRDINGHKMSLVYTKVNRNSAGEISRYSSSSSLNSSSSGNIPYMSPDLTSPASVGSSDRGSYLGMRNSCEELRDSRRSDAISSCDGSSPQSSSSTSPRAEESMAIPIPTFFEPIDSEKVIAPMVSSLPARKQNESDNDSEDDSDYNDVDGNSEIHDLAHCGSEDEQQSLQTQLEQASGFRLAINKRNTIGKTPLYLCVLCGKITAVQFLLDQGAAVAITCSRSVPKSKMDPIFDENVLHLACEKGFTKIVRLLINHPSCRDDLLNKPRMADRQTPLLLAINEHSRLSSRMDIIELLIQHGASLQDRDYKSGRTALMLLIMKHELGLALNVLEKLENREQRDILRDQDFSGNTCLHMSATIRDTNYYPDVPEIDKQRFNTKLVLFGAQSDRRNLDGMTPRDLCNRLLLNI